jgi:hypothetical protein
MTPVASLLADLHSRGIEVGTDGYRLRWRPAFMVSDATAALILSHRSEVVRLLTEPGAAPPTCPACRWPLDSGNRCPKCFDRRCEGCGRATGSYFIQRCIACGQFVTDETDGTP